MPLIPANGVAMVGVGMNMETASPSAAVPTLVTPTTPLTHHLSFPPEVTAIPFPWRQGPVIVTNRSPTSTIEITVVPTTSPPVPTTSPPPPWPKPCPDCDDDDDDDDDLDDDQKDDLDDDLDDDDDVVKVSGPSTTPGPLRLRLSERRGVAAQDPDQHRQASLPTHRVPHHHNTDGPADARQSRVHPTPT